MEINKLIGKPVINVSKEQGTITGVDSEGRIEVTYDSRVSFYMSDAFASGFLEFANPDDNAKAKFDIVLSKKKLLAKRIEQYLSELNGLVGLSDIKERVQDLVCEINIYQLRSAYGLKCPEVSKHMVFIGNPGTGKTTVARIIAKIYKTLGVLTTGQLVEADRASLVAGYQGQTAMKTKEVIKSAIGGMLFIDEAYTLCRDKDDDFGYEALDTLVKEMEDHRDNLMVVVAGYKKEMENFLNSNPGLSSRFKTVINFDDYSGNELYLISKDFLKKNDYIPSKEADLKMEQFFKEKKNLSGNGRAVRNIFEDIIRHQSRRLNGLDNINKDMLVTIEVEDLDDLLRQSY